jgi:hypothetical protein
MIEDRLDRRRCCLVDSQVLSLLIMVNSRVVLGCAGEHIIFDLISLSTCINCNYMIVSSRRSSSGAETPTHNQQRRHHHHRRSAVQDLKGEESRVH